MNVLNFHHKGSFANLERFLNNRNRDAKIRQVLEQHAQEGIAALAAATPVDSGKTASSWGYKIEVSDGASSLVFTNSNINKGVNIAVILQYGHGTGTGGYVVGRDYINPALRPVFDDIADSAWKEVTG